MRNKRIKAALAAVLIFFSSLLPFKTAIAVVPVIPLLFGAAVQSSAPLIIQATAAAEVAVAGAMTGYALEKIGAIDALGKVFDRLAFYTNGNSDQPALVVPLDPKALKKVPEGWTAAPAGQTDPRPPSTAASQTYWRTHTGYTGSSISEAVNSACSVGYFASMGGCVIKSTTPRVEKPAEYDVLFCLGSGPNCEYPFTFNVSPFVAAPPGYGNCVNGSCSLTTPSAVPYPSDGECQLALNSGQFAPDPRDPDCNGGGSTIAPGKGISIAPGKVSVASSGRRVTEIATDPVSGVVRITDTYPDVATGTTKTSVVEIDPPVAGATASSAPVAGVSVNATQGTGSLASNVAVPYVPSSVPSIQFPTDYNREATQADILAQEKKQVAELEKLNSPSNVAVPVSGLYTSRYEGRTVASSFTKFKNDFMALPLIDKTIHFFTVGDLSASCGGLNGSVDVMGKTMALDIDSVMCSSWADKVYSLLSFGIKLGAIIVAFSIAIL